MNPLVAIRPATEKDARAISALIRRNADEYGQPERKHLFPTTAEGYKGVSVRATQEHLIGCLRSGNPSESEGRDYLNTVRAVFACYESAETGQAVALA